MPSLMQWGLIIGVTALGATYLIAAKNYNGLIAVGGTLFLTHRAVKMYNDRQEPTEDV